MEREKIKINTEYIKLDQLLKFSAIADTGGIAKEIILSGDVKVNGETVLQRGKKIRSGDEVNISNQIILLVE